jgi:DNA-binding transcriptional ArsR family regulator
LETVWFHLYLETKRFPFSIFKPFQTMNQTRRDVFQAISDPTRREIIGLLSRRALNLNNVADHFTISRPAVAKHIRILTECGLVTVQTRGRETFCQADLKGLKQVSEWANTYQEFWNDKLDALERFLDEDPSDENR